MSDMYTDAPNYGYCLSCGGTHLIRIKPYNYQTGATIAYELLCPVNGPIARDVHLVL